MKIFDKETVAEFVYRHRIDVMAFFTIFVIIISFYVGRATADTITLNYSQCQDYTDSNGTVTTFCAEQWIDLNLTDVRMNATLYFNAPVEYHNETWNVTFNASAPKYNQVLSPNFGENQTNSQANITCVGLQFPALNQNVSINGGQLWYPSDTRYNLTVYCNAPSEASCKENVNATLDYGGSYYSPKGNISLSCKVFPRLDDSRTLASGETANNSLYGFFYLCQNTTPELMTCGAEKITQADVIRQMNDNATNCNNAVQSVNGSLNGCLTGLAERDKNITRSTELLANVSENKASDSRDLLALGIIVGGVVVGYIGKDYMNKRNLPPLGAADPFSLELEEKFKKHTEATAKTIAEEINKKRKEGG